MRAKPVKNGENPVEVGFTLCYDGVLILSTLAPISRRIFFLYRYIVCFGGK